MHESRSSAAPRLPAPPKRVSMVTLYLAAVLLAWLTAGCQTGEAGRASTPIELRSIVRVEVRNTVGAGGYGTVNVDENAAPGSASSVPTSSSTSTPTMTTSPELTVTPK
jgi:hypothetical protein